MDPLIIHVAPSGNARFYSRSEWEAMRPIIERIFHYENNTVNQTIQDLAAEHRFYVNHGQLTFRLGRWHLRKNCPKRNLQSPQIYRQGETLFSFIHGDIGQMFKAHWKVQEAPEVMVRDYWNWAQGLAPGHFKLLSLLISARLCLKLGYGKWAGLLLRASVIELENCLRGNSYQVLPVILILLGLIKEDELPDVRAGLLQHCLGITAIYPLAQPINNIFRLALQMFQQDHHVEYYDSMFTNASFYFLDELSKWLGENGHFACAILRHAITRLAGKEIRPAHSWVDPVSRRGADPRFFDSSQNVEQYIVQAVEIHGYPELLQVRRALDEQRNATSSDAVYNMLTEHLDSLNGPINRIGCRDFGASGNQDLYLEHWNQLTEIWISAEIAQNPAYIVDMLTAWMLFRAWGDIEQAQKAEEWLGTVFKMLENQLNL